jgi:hypothetical protein
MEPLQNFMRVSLKYEAERDGDNKNIQQGLENNHRGIQSFTIKYPESKYRNRR